MTEPARRLLLVHAHPDDETTSTGVTMARYAAQGAGVTLLTCTLGELGEIVVPELAQLAADQADQLGGYRMGELAAALINHMLKPEVQKVMGEGMGYAPGNRNVTLDALNAGRLYSTPERVARLIQTDWKWYNERKDTIDARVARILRG